MLAKEVRTVLLVIVLRHEVLVVVAKLLRKLLGAAPRVQDGIQSLGHAELRLERPHLAQVSLESRSDARNLEGRAGQEDVADQLVLYFRRIFFEDEFDRFRNSGLVVADDGWLKN